MIDGFLCFPIKKKQKINFKSADYTVGKKQGYSAGFDDGYTIGHAKGYVEGQCNANDVRREVRNGNDG
jgi:hypothetical protein